MAHAIYQSTRLQQETTATLYPARQQMYELQLALGDMERGQWGYVFTQDPAFLVTYQHGRTVARARFTSLVELLGPAYPELASSAVDAQNAAQSWTDDFAEPLTAEAQGATSQLPNVPSRPDPVRRSWPSPAPNSTSRPARSEPKSGPTSSRSARPTAAWRLPSSRPAS